MSAAIDDLLWTTGPDVSRLIEKEGALVALVYNAQASQGEKNALFSEFMGSDIQLQVGDTPWHFSTLPIRDHLQSKLENQSQNSASFGQVWGRVRKSEWHGLSNPSRYFALLNSHPCLLGVARGYSGLDDPYFRINWKAKDGRTGQQQLLYRSLYNA